MIHAISVERVKDSEAAAARLIWSDIVDDFVREVTGRIEAHRAAFPLGRQREVESLVQGEIARRIAEIVDFAETATTSAVRASMTRIARIEAAWQVQVTEPTLPIGVSMRLPPANTLRGWVESAKWRKFGGDTQRPLEQWSRGISTQVKAETRRVVTQAFVRGTPIDEVIRDVRKATDLAARQAEAVTRTAMSHGASVGAQLVAEENSDVVIGAMWVSTLDSSTTIICASLDGRVFGVDDGPRPPAHFNCRSRMRMLTRSAEDILAGKTGKPSQDDLNAARERAQQGTRASIDYRAGTAKPVSAKTTVGSWLRRQPATTQDLLLGKTRGRLFRSGQVPIDGFVGADYTPLTLRQLEARYGLTLAK